jgi:hypothetical protein
MSELGKVEGCWACELGDCGGKLSREHTVSACLFPSGNATVKGFAWCRDAPKTIGIQSLTRNILCERHNNRLSDLDSAVLEFFDAIRESGRLSDVRSKLRKNAWSVEHFNVRASHLERWLFKTLINLTYRDKFRFGDTDKECGMPPIELVQIVFGIAPFRGYAGMYLGIKPNEQITMLAGGLDNSADAR